MLGRGRRNARLLAAVVMGIPIALAFAGGSSASGTPTDPVSCAYLERGAPGPTDNELQVNEPNFGSVAVQRSGAEILVIDKLAGGAGQVVRCAGPVATIDNIDLVHVTVSNGDPTDYTYFWLDESGGSLAPGATPETDGQSEIEVRVESASPTPSPALWVKLIGQPGPDRIVVDDQQQTLLADLNADGQSHDVELAAKDAGFLEVFGGAGDDAISVPGSLAFEHTKIKGQAGNDALAANGADISGGPGNDLIHGGWFGEFFSGNAGNDRIFGGKGPDHLNGGSGRDLLNGGPGGDVLSGGPGKDKLRGGSGQDRLIR